MKVTVFGDKNNNFDGKLLAQFVTDDNNKYYLKFDVEDWKDLKTNGAILQNKIETFFPESMILQFDNEYDMPVEYARKVYTNLVSNGWTEK